MSPGGRTARLFTRSSERVTTTPILIYHCKVAGLPAPRTEYRFHPLRRWRFDLAWPQHRVAVEIDGFGRRGTPGRHQRPRGYTDDCEKLAEAACLDWRVIRVTPRQVRSGAALGWVERLLRPTEEAAAGPGRPHSLRP